MAAATPALLLLPHLSERMEELQEGLERLRKGLPEKQVTRITVGLRRGADALIIVLEPGPKFGNHVPAIAVAEAKLTGLTMVQLAQQGEGEDVRERALAQCELTVELGPRPSKVVDALRKALGQPAPPPPPAPAPEPPPPPPAAAAPPPPAAAPAAEPPKPRVRPADLRSTPRVSARLEVAFHTGAEVGKEWTENLSRGGIFVRTDSPPPHRSQVSLTLKLPGGESLALAGEVVHVVDAEAARARGTPAGCGLAFGKLDQAVEEALTAYVQSVVDLPTRLILASDSESFRQRLRPSLEQAGCEVMVIGSTSAVERILDELLDLDLLLIDSAISGGAVALVEQIRGLGETELCIAVLSPRASAEDQAKLVHAGADDLVDAGLPPAEVASRMTELVALRRG